MKRKHETLRMQENYDEEDHSDYRMRESSNDEIYTFAQFTSVVWRIDMSSVIHPFLVVDSK